MLKNMLKDEESVAGPSAMDIHRKRSINVALSNVDQEDPLPGKKQHFLNATQLQMKDTLAQGDRMQEVPSSSEKVEAFDAFHKMLNSCANNSSFNVSDAATLLRQMTPSLISSVLQIVSQKVSKSSADEITCAALKDAKHSFESEGDQEIMLIVSGPEDKGDGAKQIHTVGSNSCSPISAAVQALMSFNANDPYLKLSLKNQAVARSDSDNRAIVDVEQNPEAVDTFGSNDKEQLRQAENMEGKESRTQLDSPRSDSLTKEDADAHNVFTPIATAMPQIPNEVAVSSNQLVSELLLPTLSTMVPPLSLSYTFPASYQQHLLPSSAEAAVIPSSTSVCGAQAQKQSLPRPILPKPTESLLSTSLSGILHKGVSVSATGYASSPLMCMPVDTPVTFGQSVMSDPPGLSPQQLFSNANLNAASAIVFPKLCQQQQQQQVLQMPDALDLQQLLIRAQLGKLVPNTSSLLANPKCEMSVNQQPRAEVKKDDADEGRDLLSGKALCESNNPCNLQVAASALLSIGGSAKEKKSNSNQVVAAFNREKATYDLKESADANKNDVLYTSSGTFQIEDVEIDPRKNRIEKDNYECGKCGRVFTSIIYLARHIKRVCPDMSHRKWKCDRCDKAFRHPFGLQQHIYTHTGERPFKCEQCAKAFYSANDLRRHKRTHSGERPYKCSHCAKTFSTTISLKTHTYIHTGERPHKCPACPKTFATSSKLSRHVVTHSDRRPFSCDLCPKTFNRSGDLRRHYNNVHGQEHKLMECDECNKVFATQQCLTSHRQTHNRDMAAAAAATAVIRVGLL